MRKIISLIALVVTLVLSVGCGGNQASDKAANQNKPLACVNRS